MNRLSNLPLHHKFAMQLKAEILPLRAAQQQASLHCHHHYPAQELLRTKNKAFT